MQQEHLKTVATRRDFLKKSLASTLLFSKTSSLLASSLAKPQIKELETLSERPYNAEALPHLLDDEVTPTSRLFVRNNGVPPEITDLNTWSLKIDGEIKKPLQLSLTELKKLFKTYSYQLVLECGGNGRAGFSPQTPGLQWTYGAVGCPLWHGIRLKDLLNYAGLKSSATYLGYYGLDMHPSGDPRKDVISRGFPIHKAMEDTTLLAFSLNNKVLPKEHGYPLRIICPGYPGSASGKWLKRIWIRDKVHDGEKMGGESYRIPKDPVRPGDISKQEMMIIEKMPVKSLITSPQSGLSMKLSGLKKGLPLRGFAWTGEQKIRACHLSCDFGQTWIKTKLEAPKNPFAWQRWSGLLKFSRPGYYEIWARAIDSSGKMQPMVVPSWNAKGYLNNAMPRIALTLT